MGAFELEGRALRHEFTEADGLVRGDPVGCVVSLARGNRRQRMDLCHVAAHGLPTQDQAQGRRPQLLLVAPLQHEQFDVGPLRMAHQADRGALGWRQFEAFGSWLLGADQHDGMAIGQIPSLHREDRAAFSRQRAQPRGHDGRRAQAIMTGLRAEHHGHLDPAGTPPIEPRGGEQGQFVFQCERAHGELEAAGVHIDVGPQAAVQGVFAFERVVPDQAQAEPVVVHEEARVQLDGSHDALARLVRPQGNDGQQLVVEPDLQVGQGGQQGRGRRDRQVQASTHHHFVQAHAEVDAVFAGVAAKRQAIAGRAPQRQLDGAQRLGGFRWGGGQGPGGALQAGAGAGDQGQAPQAAEKSDGEESERKAGGSGLEGGHRTQGHVANGCEPYRRPCMPPSQENEVPKFGIQTPFFMAQVRY